MIGEIVLVRRGDRMCPMIVTSDEDGVLGGWIVMDPEDVVEIDVGDGQLLLPMSEVTEWEST